MPNDIHIYLTDEEDTALRAMAAKEVRSLTNMARVLIGRARGTDWSTPPNLEVPKRGRPRKDKP